MVGEGDVVVCWFWGVSGFLAVAGFVVEATGAAAVFGGFFFPD